MAHLSTPRLDPVPVDVRARRWTMRVIALLLVVQTVLLFTVSGIYLSQLEWERQMGHLRISKDTLDSLLLVFLLAPLGVFNLITAFSMWLGRRGAWLRAMIAQGILLIFCLSSYAAGRSERFIYALMLTAIIIVLYLNTNDVRITYQSTVHERREHPRRA